MSKGYNLFFGKVQLPIAPESIETKINNQNTTINLINDTEVNILKLPGLTEFSFELLIPQVKYPFASYPDGFKKADYYLGIFEKLKTSKCAFQFIVSRATPGGKLLFDTNMKVSLEEYTITEDASNGFDLKVSVALKQYKDYGTKTVKIKIVDNRPKPIIQQPAPQRSSSSGSGGSSKKPTIGCDVIVNGQLHRDSYGAGPGAWRHNYKGKINFIKEGRSHPYHITTPSGGWQGWVVASAVQVI